MGGANVLLRPWQAAAASSRHSGGCPIPPVPAAPGTHLEVGADKGGDAEVQKIERETVWVGGRSTVGQGRAAGGRVSCRWLPAAVPRSSPTQHGAWMQARSTHLVTSSCRRDGSDRFSPKALILQGGGTRVGAWANERRDCREREGAQARSGDGRQACEHPFGCPSPSGQGVAHRSPKRMENMGCACAVRAASSRQAGSMDQHGTSALSAIGTSHPGTQLTMAAPAQAAPTVPSTMQTQSKRSANLRVESGHNDARCGGRRRRMTPPSRPGYRRHGCTESLSHSTLT